MSESASPALLPLTSLRTNKERNIFTFNNPKNLKYINDFIANSLREDVGDGDHTSIACIPAKVKGKARLLVKENGVIAGIELAKFIVKKVDRNLRIRQLIKDGSTVKPGDVAFTIEGSARSILKAERLILNCMQRMSGIATKTNKLVQLCKGTKAKVIDTRKTTPGLRFLEKWAVKIGGGSNHRFGLYDMILIKDNHIDFAGGIEKAIEAANKYQKKKKLKIEIEARNMTEVKQILTAGKVQRIMLDNFPISDLKRAVKLINRKYETEASGGITEKNIRNYALCGVDYISIGALTHSVKSLDLSLKSYA
ncbi:MAG: carboxylating nicotinate-nucleotide diphosphorylase [Bacteroidetes bacterium]|nr:carboxylating nicotinate-nucleotide diphosphorylase [Bacteroidota bacterium]